MGLLDFYEPYEGKKVFDETPTFEQFRLMRYATRIWLLQERARLSYLQARLYLRDEWPGTFDELVEKYKIPVDNFIRWADEIDKIVEEELKHNDIFLGHGPIYLEDKDKYS